jgi:ATP phosphoribosyltransferase
MENNPSTECVRLALPKGRMKDGVFSILSEAGIRIKVSERGYRPYINLPDFEVKILKPQNIVEMLDAGSRDIGFAGDDWVQEKGAKLVELVDTGMDPVKVVAAAPRLLLDNGKLPKQHLVIASEYENLTRNWIKREGLDATFVPSYGATEVFPPEDADCIVDNTSTGSTLRANDLDIVGTVATSSTRLYANPRALEIPKKKAAIENFAMLVQSVLAARSRVMVEVNVTADKLDSVVEALPCMRDATVSPLRGSKGFAVKAAVPRDELPTVIPMIKSSGGTDIVVTRLSQLVP